MFGGSEGFPVGGPWSVAFPDSLVWPGQLPLSPGPEGQRAAGGPARGAARLCVHDLRLFSAFPATLLCSGLAERGIRLCWRPGLAPPTLTPELPAACPAAAHLGSHRDLEGSPLPSVRVVGVVWGVVLGTRVWSPAPVLGQLGGGGWLLSIAGLVLGVRGGWSSPTWPRCCPAICPLSSPSWSLAETVLPCCSGQAPF